MDINDGIRIVIYTYLVVGFVAGIGATLLWQHVFGPHDPNQDNGPP